MQVIQRYLAVATLSMLALPALTTSAQAVDSCRAVPAEISGPMLARVNAERRAQGLRPLQLDAKLTRAAQGHACDMATKGFFDHHGSDGKTPKTRVKRAGYRTCLTAENISFGWRSVDQVMQDLMQSPKHRANILRGSVQEIGIGYVPRTGNQGPWWVQVFANPC
ncbi:hypothetical protein CCR83_12895 [Rhodobacter veldkampii DSM 11550]|uniref:CAP domain-containing protein n=1 Tax=Phaeovulum veldkampii DSM 11550 TaxID=1185920 RepID=A0A2T4JC71_9RHOB|nr:CAP domain-containing protein [Phaeovulum veldkampii]MBK5947314.1 hypothetical protein [Phaeovulum veldkampii DSM 11550]PTE15491.1 CAP domain-containing protein [Phaeovulum veldkampii DSM 11550]